jgi:hypothetical protein
MQVSLEIAFKEWAVVVDAPGRGEQILQQRFEFGRAPGLHALITHVYQPPAPQQVAMHENNGGYESWIQLERKITADVTPVLTDAEFAAQREEICELPSSHALAHP